MKNPSGTRARARLVVPSRTDALLRSLTEVVGGPLGHRTAPGVVKTGFFSVDRVLIILTLIGAGLALLLKSHCISAGWSSPDQFYATCYSDWPELFRRDMTNPATLPGLSGSTGFEYPALLGAIGSLLSFLIPGSGAGPERVLGYFALNAVIAVVIWIAVVITTARLARRRAWDAAMVALAPGIITAGFINWDIWAVGMVSMAMLSFARGRLVSAGVWIGVGVAFKLYPGLILVALLILAIRTGILKAFAVPAVAATLTWLLINLPLMLINPGAFFSFYSRTATEAPGYSSVWFIYNLMAPRTGQPKLDPALVSVLWIVVFLLLVVAIAALTLLAPRRPRLAQVAFLLVAAYILCSKTYSPQFVLWLIPLAVLARPRWADFLIWQGIELLHWGATWLYIGKLVSNGNDQHNIDSAWYSAAVIAHMVAVLYLMIRVVLEILAPAQDVVRVGNTDDPQGGPFDHVSDPGTSLSNAEEKPHFELAVLAPTLSEKPRSTPPGQEDRP